MKRFWTTASVERRDGLGHVVLLDGKPVHIPGGSLLAVPGPALAGAIAEEWQEAGGDMDGAWGPTDTPLTQLAGTAIHRIAPDPAPTVDALAAYGEADLLCYRATHPAPLIARQAREWQPWLDWAASALDAPLRVTAGIGFVKQDPAALASLRRVVAAADAWTLAGLGVAVPALGSLVLGLALAAQRLDPAEAHSLATLDARFQAEAWGVDEEAAARDRAVAADVALADRFMRLARADATP